ncbi:MAG: ATP-dependent DNA helicase RecG [Proteobacteria bacterium]|nr:ATP-dependent DNA helicase RecG [Pseudomonadota bacterium]
MAPINLIVDDPKTVHNLKGLENYYKSLCELFVEIPSIYKELTKFEEYFRDIDSKSFEEKRNILLRLLSLYHGPFFEFKDEELKIMGDFLQKEITDNKWFGEKALKKLIEKGLKTYRDILFFFPYKYIDKRRLMRISELKPGIKAYFKAKIIEVGDWSKKGFLDLRGNGMIVRVSDGTGIITLKWFTKPPVFIKNLLQKGNEIIVFGNVDFFRGNLEIHHPEIEKFDENKLKESDLTFNIHPVYFGLPNGVSEKLYRKLVFNVASMARNILKTLVPQPLKEELNLLEWGDAIYHIHFPKEDFNYEKYEKFRSPYHLTLIYQELFLLFSLFLRKKRDVQKAKTSKLNFSGELARKVLMKFGYKLTEAQKRVIREIKEDLEKPYPMQRLLQGDVGSGKTIVAFLSSLLVIEAGKQVAIMAPTEILAEQHFINFKNLVSETDLKICLLTSSLKKKEKEEIVKDIKDGKYQLIVGTHALIQENVDFNNLGLVIIDEQHRFGVEQRNRLIKKGDIIPHALFMTATPIPRTLAMTIHGDLDISVIDELPPGRKEIKTIVLPELQRERAFGILNEELKKGRQAYIVYPVIDEDNALELKAATQMYEFIKGKFSSHKVGLLHGRLKPEEKEEIMSLFKDNKISILVSTTVIEVGVDVPNATIMIIEHGERFGLSQLHQLRGRIGRGGEASICIVLVDTKKISNKARERLIFFRDNLDGFKLAEFDLKMRGPGELLGTRQSGLPEFSIVELVRDASYVEFMKNKTEGLLGKVSDEFANNYIPKITSLYFGEKGDLLNAG